MDAIAEGTLVAEIVGVFSDRSKAVALQRARDVGIAARSLAPKNFASRAEFAAALFAAVDEVRPDLIVCAGYMRLIRAVVVDALTGLLIHIHPSLPPELHGLHTHQSALDALASATDASDHFVPTHLSGRPDYTYSLVHVH